MLKRSTSQTHIPLPKSLNQKGSKRSTSLSRLSSRDSISSIPKSTNKPFDKRSGIVKSSKITPVHLRIRGSSLRSTPLSSVKSLRTPGSGHKESIQKLTTDKKWVAQQFAKVQDFILYSKLFDFNIVDPSNMKPPTIKLFIYITTVLFQEIFPMFKMSQDNYKEVILEKLKLLHYPGTLPNSTLKTVNTIHSWPQVVAMWSWLIDMVKLSSCNEDDDDISSLEPEEKLNYVKKQLCTDLFAMRYLIFNNGNDTDQITEANENYLKKLSELLHVDAKQFEKLEYDVLQKRQYKINQEKEIFDLTEKKMRLKGELDKVLDEINNIKASKGKVFELEEEIDHLNKKLENCSKRKNQLKENIIHLEEGIKVQPCTYQEKLKLQNKISNLKNEIKFKKDKMLHAQKIKEDYDNMLEAELEKLQTKVMEWNKSLMAECIRKPHLKTLCLPERGFHSPLFLEEIQRVLEQKNKIEDEFSKELVEIDAKIKKKELEKHEVLKEIEQINKKQQQVTDLTEDVIAKTNQVHKKTEEILSEWARKKQDFMQQLTKKDDKLEELDRKKHELLEERNRLCNERQNLSKKMLVFFIDLQKETKNKIQEMMDVMNTTENSLQNRVREAINSQKELLKGIKSLQEMKENFEDV